MIFIVFPVIMFSFIQGGLINFTKIIYFKRYMLCIENKMNKLLKLSETKSIASNIDVADREHWLLAHGFQKKLFLNFNTLGAASVLVIIFAFMIIDRLSFFKKHDNMFDSILYMSIFIILVIIEIVITLYAFKLMNDNFKDNEKVIQSQSFK